MFYREDSHLRFISKQFSYSADKLKAYLAGKEGEEKQLFANLLISYDEEFINFIKSKKQVELIPVEYLDLRTAEELFGFRKFQLDQWNSKQRKLLIDCLCCTPLCYITFLDSVNQAHVSLKNLFPKPVDSKKCMNCNLNNTCVNK